MARRRRKLSITKIEVVRKKMESKFSERAGDYIEAIEEALDSALRFPVHVEITLEHDERIYLRKMVEEAGYILSFPDVTGILLDCPKRLEAQRFPSKGWNTPQPESAEETSESAEETSDDSNVHVVVPAGGAAAFLAGVLESEDRLEELKAEEAERERAAIEEMKALKAEDREAAIAKARAEMEAEREAAQRMIAERRADEAAKEAEEREFVKAEAERQRAQIEAAKADIERRKAEREGEDGGEAPASAQVIPF